VSVPAAYLGVILIWSTTPLAIQWSAQGATFSFAVMARMLIGLAICLALLRLTRTAFPFTPAARRLYAISGLSIFAAMLLTYWGALHIPSGLISVIFGLSPLVTGVFAALWLSERTLTPIRITGLGLALAGLWLIFGQPWPGDSQATHGTAAVVAGMAVQALGLVWVKRLNLHASALAITTGSLGVATPLFVLAWLIERLVLRHLVNQEGVTLLMATLGITYFLDGLGQTIFGSDIYQIDVGMPKDPIFLFESVFEGGVLLNLEDVYAACVAALLVVVLSLFFQKTSTGRALRAVADDHQAAQSIGIPLNRIWVIVWFVAGITALVAGIIWGSKMGVQFSLTTVALRALPVIILGGLTSVPGAIIGGLIIGVGEKLSEVYIGPMVGGGIEIWFAYVLALVFLLFRPQGLFGEKIIDRV